MRNRLLKHITDQFKANHYSASEVIEAQAGTIKRLSEAYETLHNEHQAMRNSYAKAWDYFKKIHDRARVASNHLPFWESVINEVVSYNKEVAK